MNRIKILFAVILSVISLAGNAQEKRITNDVIKVGNPIITDKYTADPAALVYKDKFYLYTGHDIAPKGVTRYVMNDWTCYSSSDMVNWEEHPVPLKDSDFSWAKGDAGSSQVIERNGKFYWYVG